MPSLYHQLGILPVRDSLPPCAEHLFQYRTGEQPFRIPFVVFFGRSASQAVDRAAERCGWTERIYGVAWRGVYDNVLRAQAANQKQNDQPSF